MKKQASLLLKEKIQKELMKMSPRLTSHIKEIKTSQNECEVIFENGSSFICCVAGEQSRGIRSTVLLVDEFRLVKKLTLYIEIYKCNWMNYWKAKCVNN